MSEGKLMAEQARGERAAALLRDPLIAETFDALHLWCRYPWQKTDSHRRGSRRYFDRRRGHDRPARDSPVASAPGSAGPGLRRREGPDAG